MGEARRIGVVSAAMAARHGLSARTLRRHAAKERWVSLQPGVWLVSGFADTHRRRCHAVQQRAGAEVVIAGRQQDLFTEDDLREVLARLWPAFGTGVLAWVLDEMHGVDSGFEWTVRCGLAAAGLPEPHPEPYELPCPDGVSIHLDIAWPAWRVGLEVMGASVHGLQTSRTDQIRQAAGLAGGAVSVWP